MVDYLFSKLSYLDPIVQIKEICDNFIEITASLTINDAVPTDLRISSDYEHYLLK